MQLQEVGNAHGFPPDIIGKLVRANDASDYRAVVDPNTQAQLPTDGTEQFVAVFVVEFLHDVKHLHRKGHHQLGAIQTGLEDSTGGNIEVTVGFHLTHLMFGGRAIECTNQFAQQRNFPLNVVPDHRLQSRDARKQNRG